MNNINKKLVLKKDHFKIHQWLSLILVVLVSLTLTACTSTGSNQVSDAGQVLNEDEVTPVTHGPATTSTYSNRPHLINYEPDTSIPWLSLVTQIEAEQPVISDIGPDDYSKYDHIDSVFEKYNGKILADNSTEYPNDLWQRIRNGLRLKGQDHRFVKPYIKWYAEHQAYLDRVAKRARPFLYDIVEEIDARDMPMEIALLPIVESAFQPFAYSPGRAAGIWQFIPATGKIYGLKQNWWYDGRRDVPLATKAALKYLSRLHKRFNGDWLLALASYNTGEGRVARAVKKNKKKGRLTDFWSLDLPTETKGYVPKLLAISAIVSRSKEFGVTLESIPNSQYLERIDIGSQIDLAMAAELAGLPLETIYRLNPAFNRWATDPKGPHFISLPIDKTAGFLDALARVDKNKRIRWQRHKIRKGETLGQIARKYQTTIELLQDVNNIRDKWIRAGKNIIIPVATKNLRHYLSEDQRRLTLQRTNRRGIKVKYTVRPGDTFWDISRKYKVKVGQLASWNGMSPRDSLMPGQRLVIWAKNRSIASARYASPPMSSTRQQVHYKVRKGDSLARIAQKFSVTISKLRRWNSLPKGKYLQPGQRLTLYVDVTKQQS